ncbi:unnamed protein product [Zymoseptoria tritici ST99CH_3D1]|uniref:Uncharacterized protein n=1 Tax=Zymoseptoria tritici (strain ST99CH_3D7) TaxID=1276538 RepID=A0A1X7S389_ZYMT9|nr:unnamed protein product [Zymoseptoria tritici ST99CH_3D7]SMR61570.1 unnamed protein product [Zymoseptoria tritici ST99CH_3D1]
MHTNICAAAAVLIAIVNARIIGFTAPLTMAPSDEIKLGITVGLFDEKVLEYMMAFGFTPGDETNAGALGKQTRPKYLGQDFSNTTNTIDHYVSIPPTAKVGETYTLKAALVSSSGPENDVLLTMYALKVTVAETTGSQFGDASQVAIGTVNGQ